jgi:uncharacterized protein (DUF885 family)
MRALLFVALTACTTHPPAPPPAEPAPPVAHVEPAPPPAPPPVDPIPQRRKALAALLDEHWQHELRTHPERASLIGDHRYDDRWTDMSPAAIEAELAKTKEFLDRFAALDVRGLSEQEVLDQQLMIYDLKQKLDEGKLENWLMPVNQMSGPHLMPARLSSLLRFASVADYEAYLARLHALPALLDQATTLMRGGMGKGLMPPRQQLELVVKQVAEMAKAKPDASPFAHPVQQFPDAVAQADRDRLRAATLEAITKEVLPAYGKLGKFLADEYAPHGRKEPGVWSLPDGEARYQMAIREMTTTTMPADQIHELGLSEVARIEKEQEAIGKSLGFKTLAAFRDHVRKDPKLYAKSREDILDRYQRFTDQMYGKLPELFGRLPAQKMKIVKTEEFREKDASGAEYVPGSPDGARPGTVQVNTSNPTKRLWIDMESTAYHEGVPGHHLQLTIQHELGELPPFRQFGGYTAFIEGWALYSERLGKEVGFYTDPYSDYGRLQDELLRAIRLVVDTGLHSKKWTREQVVKFFHDHSTIDEPSVQAETNRYIVWPAQALAYKVGQLTILRLRGEAKESLGDRFDLRAFHDQVLGAGALPLDVLEARIHAWIAAQKR